MSRKKKNEGWGENGFEEWGGYMAAKKAKLQEQFEIEANNEHADASTLFRGISIFVNGYTNPTADELRRLMMAHGGIFHHYMRPRMTTHVIASNLPYSKIVMYRKSQNPVPICKPEWITDSIKAGKVLNFQDYLLYTNCTETQPKLAYKIQAKTGGKEDATIVDESDTSMAATKKLAVSEKKSEAGSSLVPKTTARCTKDAGFLSEFYSHSRLHHISTMGATFKNYVNELRDKSTGKFPGLAKLKEKQDTKSLNLPFSSESLNEVLDSQEERKAGTIQEPVVMHIDMDCFFVSVGIRDKPELKGVPVAVTHAKGNKQSVGETKSGEDDWGSLSEVASCSYEARKAGVKNGMFLGEALKICPNLKPIPYDFDGYTEVSYTLYDTVASYTLDIEAVSCDELYADCTKILEQSGLTPLEFASLLRKEIREITGCPVSTGFGRNKLLARLATRKAKPDGQFYMKKDQVKECIGALDVRDLPGVGWTTAHKLNGLKVRTCSELRGISLTVLQNEFGKKTGEMLYNMCRGIDHSKLNLEHVRKSVSAEVNYGIRFENNEDAIDFLKKLSEEVYNRLKSINARGRCITLKLLIRAKDAPKDPPKFMGCGACDYITRSKNLISAVNDVAIITKEVLALWSQLQQVPEDTRGIGIQITRLETLKSKTRHTALTSFVNKDKNSCLVAGEINTASKTNPAKIAVCRSDSSEEPKPQSSRGFFSSSNNKQYGTAESGRPETLTKSHEKQELALPPDINKSVFGALPKDIQDEILGLAQEGRIHNVIQVEASADNKQGQREEYSGTSSSSGSNRDESLSRNQIHPIPTTSTRIPEPSRVTDENEAKNPAGTIKPATSLGKSSSKTKDDSSERNVQTMQEQFFKHTKPNSGKSAKVEMPPIQELDMAVLIELPEDIRNEILNEYSANRQRQRTDSSEANNPIAPATASNARQDEQDISFSQVDPEFLAALSEDLQQEVQLYCDNKKAQRQSKNELPVEEVISTSETVKAPNLPRPSKKSGRPAKQKNIGKGTKHLQQKTSKSKKVPAIFKTSKPKDEGPKIVDVKLSETKSAIIREKIDIDPAGFTLTPEDTETIISRNRSFIDNDTTADQHQDMLIGLVNHLFKLPLDEVKVQVQSWISNSNFVNEVDFVSFATFLSMLPEKRRIEDLHVLLKTMHRCMVKTGNCIWHRTYRKTVKHVQHYMQIEYNSNLMIPSIRCNVLQCNSDVL